MINSGSYTVWSLTLPFLFRWILSCFRVGKWVGQVGSLLCVALPIWHYSSNIQEIPMWRYLRRNVNRTHRANPRQEEWDVPLHHSEQLVFFSFTVFWDFILCFFLFLFLFCIFWFFSIFYSFLRLFLVFTKCSHFWKNVQKIKKLFRLYIKSNISKIVIF